MAEQSIGRRRMLPPRLGLSAVVLVAATAATGMLPLEPARADPPRLRFLAFNMCGGICNDGTVDRPGPDNDVVEHVASTLSGFRPHVAVLNEICGAQHHRLVRLLERAGYPMRSAFHAQRTADRRCPPHDGFRSFGDAVLSSGPVDRTEVHRLPNRPSGRERRSLLCLRTTHHGTRFLACGLHLVALDPEWHARQLDKTVWFVRQRSTYIPVMLAGDFNARPHELGRVTNPGQGGFHTDVDHVDHEPTFYRRKIDYIFLPNGRFRDLSGEAHTSRWSDHRILMGRATLQP